MSISRLARLVALALLLAGPDACKKPQVARKSGFDTHWSTETQFIVESTVIDLAGMAYYAKHGQAVGAGQLQVEAQEVAGPGGQPVMYVLRIRDPADLRIETKLSVTGSIWDPKMYRAVVAMLFDSLNVDPARQPPEDSSHRMLRGLSDGTPGVVERENGTISAELRSNFLSPGRHEQAALVLAAFTLREYSGKFFEIRSELCRMTAHLAFAQALRRGATASPEGQLASATLAALYDDQRSALQQLEGLPAGDPAIEAWVRALRIRITGDYRLLAGAEVPTFMERREAFAAQLRAVNPAAVNGMLAETDEFREHSDWARILNARGAGVEIGHEILRRSLGDEISEARQVYLLATGEELREDAFVEKLNVEPEPCVTGQSGGPPVVRVIGWGHWAAFLQRHLCHAIQSDFKFLQTMWGVPEQARNYRDAVDRRFSQLRLYPFVRRQNATEGPYYRQAQDAEMAVIHHRPHLVPVEVWNEICDKVPCADVYFPPPHPYVNEWHRFNPPPGTAYDLEPRMRHPSLTNRPDCVALLAGLHEMAPYDATVTHFYLWQHVGAQRWTQPTGPAMEKGYGPVLDFDSNVIAAIADAYKTEPERYAQWMGRAAHIDPLWNYPLAEFYVAAGRDADAARAYEKIVFSDPDAVRMSIHCGWLVKYYERNGSHAEATSLARNAAEVYSSSGLQSLASLLEMRGDFAGAIEYYRKVYERYNSPGSLVACLLRYQRATGRSVEDPVLRRLVLRILPKGLEKINDEKLERPPRLGVVLQQESPETRKAGLKRTDVIVGGRGYKVYGSASYEAVRDMDPNTPFVLHVWRNGDYRRINAAPPDNRFGVGLNDYVAK